jgi:hypothetical protein
VTPSADERRIPELARKHGVTFMAGPLVLDAEHEGLAIVEAARVEDVHRFVFGVGWCSGTPCECRWRRRCGVDERARHGSAADLLIGTP